MSFVPPPGFTRLDAEWLARKYPNAGSPRNAVGNARRTTTIAYEILDGPTPSNDLETLRRLFITGLSQAPKLRWLANETRQLSHQDWVYLECTTAAVDQDIRNILLLTVVDDRVVLFNFNSTVAEFGALEKALRASMASITIEPRR